MNPNPKAVAKAIANNRETALRGAVKHNWRIRTTRKGDVLVLSNRAENEK
jgi:hypothetical protein